MSEGFSKQQRYFETTLNCIGDAVISTNEHGVIEYMNPASEAITGWKLEDALGKSLENIFKIVNEQTREVVESPVDKVLREGTVVGLANHTLLLSKDGREIPIADSGSPIKNDQGEIAGVVLVFRDQTEEKMYLEKIARSEAQYRELVESTDAIAWEYDVLLDQWVYVAPQVTSKMGWLPEEWTNLEFWRNNVHPDEREGTTNYCLECTARGEPHSLEYRFKCKNGSYIWLRDVVSVVFKDNTPLKLHGVMFDITERKNIELALQEKNSFIQTVLDNLPIGLALNKINDGSAFYMNRKFEEIYGWNASEIEDISLFFEKVYPDEEYRKELIKKVTEGMESGDPRKMHWEDIEVTKSDGSTGVIEAVNIPLPEQNTMVSTVMDTTARKKAEKELKESEERFRTAILRAPIPIMVHDEDGKVLNISEGWTRFSGYSLEDIPTLKVWTEKAYGEKAREVEAYVSGLFKENETVLSGEFEIQTKSGKKRIWSFYTTFLGKLSSGQRIMLSMAPDITQLKEIQIELEEAKKLAEESERLKMAFLANMSHEIRTPLNGILGFTNLLAERKDLSAEDKKGYAFIINKSAGVLLKIINDILDISRLETSHASIERRSFDAGGTLSTVYSIFQKKFAETEKKDVDLILKLPEAQVVLNTDETRLIQIFSNLLDNALRFTSKGNVTFGISEISEGKATFFVTDTGIGISKENHDRIFDRFSQANGATRSYGGTGLGLTIVKKLLEMMGSKITLESEPGKGASFRFQLDCSSAAKTEKNTDVRVKDGSNKLTQKRILVVEDDAVSRLYFKQILSSTEAEVLFAENGEEALHRFEKQNPDLILLDIGLPDINGLEVVRRIREIDEKVIIVAQTAFAMYDDKQNAMKAGCNDYIAKPINSALLLKKIEQLCS